MNNSNLSLANRKQLADMLNDRYDGLRYKAKQKFKQKASELRKALIDEYAEKKGASAVVRQIDAANKKLQELNLELKQLGFEVCYGSLRLFDENSNPLDDAIDKRVEKDLGCLADIDARFDSAQLAMMTVPTLEEARKLFESVANA
jgi:hypothetical protein